MRLPVSLMLFAVVASCSDPVAPVHEVAGTWSGMTGQMRAFSFVVDPDNEIRSVNVLIEVGNSGCSLVGNYGFGGTGLEPFAVVAKNSFSGVKTTAGGTMTFTINGEFSSPTQASGTLKAVHTQCGSIQTPWTATRNPQEATDAAAGRLHGIADY